MEKIVLLIAAIVCIRCVRKRTNGSGADGAQCDRSRGPKKFPRRRRVLSAAAVRGGGGNGNRREKHSSETTARATVFLIYGRGLRRSRLAVSFLGHGETAATISFRVFRPLFSKTVFRSPPSARPLPRLAPSPNVKKFETPPRRRRSHVLRPAAACASGAPRPCAREP